MAEYKIPKRMKYRKQQRGRMSGVSTRGAEISFGEYGLKALEPAWITGKQIEASRVAMTRFVNSSIAEIDWRSFNPNAEAKASCVAEAFSRALFKRFASSREN